MPPKIQNIALHRLGSQQIAAPQFKRVEQVVAGLGAMQAQDFGGGKWAIGLRMPNATEADIDKAIAEKKIIRTWPMRGTLHFVAAEDVHWIRALLTPRILSGSTNRHLALELDIPTFARCEKYFIKALRGGKQLTREALYAVLEKNGITTSGPRTYHIIWRLAQEGLLCFGTHEGKQATFALLDEWAPVVKKWERDESLAELALRYFTGHGPATLKDFVWWSGLKVSDARAAIDMVASKLIHETIGAKTYWMSPAKPAAAKHTAYLLPGFDEHMLGYTDRSDALAPKFAQRICPGANGVFANTIVLNGQVSGTWRRTTRASGIAIATAPFTKFTKPEKEAISAACERFGKFVGKTVASVT